MPVPCNNFMAILKTPAIVLKSFDFRETSRIATFFTREFGKMSGVLKGIRKDPRKFASSVERFSVNDIVYYQYRNSDLHLISQCDMREFYIKIRQDIKCATAASYASELVNVIMPSEEKNLKVYDLMNTFLASLGDADDVDRLIHIFQIKILLYSGFRPHLDACLDCKRKITTTVWFDIKDGGLVCFSCRQPSPQDHILSQGLVASILHIERSPWEQCLKLRISAPEKKELKFLLNNFLVYHLGKRLKSARFLS